MEEKSVEITNSKKPAVYGIVGAVIVLALLGAFIPTAKDYITAIVKILLEGIKIFI